MTLSIIITLLNDDAECHATIASLRATAPKDLEILVIDDCSDKPFKTEDPFVRVVRNQVRLGCAPSRHKGAELANGTHVLFIDSHMRAEPGWFENLMRRIEASPQTSWNGTCLGLAEGRMELPLAKGEYRGARMNLFGTDKNKPSFKQVMEAQWHPHQDNEAVGAFMGAIYCVPKDVFFAVGGLEGLQAWGGDEPYLSLKLWLCGYEIRQAADVRMGHKFRDAAPYSTHTWRLAFNKIWMILTLFGDSDEAMFLIGKLKSLTPAPDWKQCMAEMVRRQPQIVSTYEANRTRFRHDLRWYCDKFGCAYPEVAPA